MASKGQVLEMLERAINHEEHIIVGWALAIDEWLPKVDITNEQKNQLRDIVHLQTTQSFKHKEMVNAWFKKVSESGKSEY
jgi:hypothetical protein